MTDMQELKKFASSQLGILPEQVQVFTPTPSTYASVMYYTGKDPFTGETLFVEKNPAAKQRQKEVITGRGELPEEHRRPKRKGKNRDEKGGPCGPPFIV